MANGHGGHRTPEHPAPVSGPGRYSRRTDGGPAQSISATPNQDYGEAKQQRDAQRIAPMAGKTPLPSAVLPSGGEAPPSLPAFSGTPLDAPSQRPGDPITTGVDIGDGAGSEILGLPNPAQGTGQMTALLQRYAATSANGQLAALLQKAQARNA